MTNNANGKYPERYLEPVQNGGEIVKLQYTAKRYLTDETPYEKTAYVYLPAGYDANDKQKKYNVLYLMHGGGASAELFFVWGTQNGGSTPTKNLLDNLIANGDLEPCIVCTPTYNMDGSKDQTACCLNYYKELINDLIPAVEGTYNTYAEALDLAGIEATRSHRAFGGFSMGACATWGVFEHALKYVRYFLPLCGDCWTLGMGGGAKASDETVAILKKSVLDAGYTADDFRIFWGTGTKDMAYPNVMPMLEAMKKLGDPFLYCDNYQDGNLYCCVLDEGGHDFPTVHTAIYNGLNKFFQ